MVCRRTIKNTTEKHAKRESIENLSHTNTSQQTHHRLNIESSTEPIATLQVDRFNNEVSPISSRGANVDSFEPLWGIVEKVQRSPSTVARFRGRRVDIATPLLHSGI
jgi:hypothetical protein